MDATCLPCGVPAAADLHEGGRSEDRAGPGVGRKGIAHGDHLSGRERLVPRAPARRAKLAARGRMLGVHHAARHELLRAVARRPDA